MLAYRSFEVESCVFEETGLASGLVVVVRLLVDVAIFGELE